MLRIEQILRSSNTRKARKGYGNIEKDIWSGVVLYSTRKQLYVKNASEIKWGYGDSLDGTVKAKNIKKYKSN